MKPVKLSRKRWTAILDELLKEYPPSVCMIRWRMKEVLGFTTREGSIDEMFLDFFDEKKRSFFLLKYSEYINGVDQRY